MSGADGESHLFLDTNDDGSVSPIDMMRVISQLNAEGESSTPLANYTINIYADATSTTPITSVPQNSDFYMSISAADLRPDGTYGDALRPCLRGIIAAYTDVNFDKNFVQVAVSEVQNLKITTAAGSGTFTLSANGKTSPTISYNTANVAATATAIQTALNDPSMLGANAVTVAAFGSGIAANYRITFGAWTSSTSIKRS